MYKRAFSQVIRNSNLPVCKKCSYYREMKKSVMNGKCTKFGFTNIVTGEVHYEYAQISRNKDDLCGKTGLYFKSVIKKN